MTKADDDAEEFIIGQVRREPGGVKKSFPQKEAGFSSPLFISAGDLSGDIHAARLVDELLRRHPKLKVFALGGAHLQKAGATLLENTSGFGVMGFASSLLLLPRVPALKKKIERFLADEKPAAAVLCDWGGFNTRLLRTMQEYSVPTLYYFPPRSWQKSGAAGTSIAPLVDCVATPFEWSAQKLNAAGGRAYWVGHPLLEMVQEARREYSRAATRTELGLKENELLVAILPGSRDMELKILPPILSSATGLLQREYSTVRFVVAVPPGAARKLHGHFPASIPILENRTTELLLAADAAIVKSGTATLEAAVCDVPQVVVYDLPPLLRAQWLLTGLGKKVAMVAMPNIILDRMAVPELLGNDCRPSQIAHVVSTLLGSAAERENMRADYREVRCALGEGLPYTATARTADLLEELLGGNSPAHD